MLTSGLLLTFSLANSQLASVLSHFDCQKSSTNITFVQLSRVSELHHFDFPPLHCLKAHELLQLFRQVRSPNHPSRPSDALFAFSPFHGTFKRAKICGFWRNALVDMGFLELDKLNSHCELGLAQVLAQEIVSVKVRNAEGVESS